MYDLSGDLDMQTAIAFATNWQGMSVAMDFMDVMHKIPRCKVRPHVRDLQDRAILFQL